MLSLFVYHKVDQKAHELNDRYVSCLKKSDHTLEKNEYFSDSAKICSMISGFDQISMYMLTKDSKLTQIAGHIQSVNQSNYIVLVLSEPSQLLDAVSPCLKPSGLLLENSGEERIVRVLDEIYSDYNRVCQMQDRDTYNFRIRGVEYAVAFCKIMIIEVQSKKITFHTQAQSYEFYDSLESVMKNIPDYFLRVHRSFVVNTNFIRIVNYSEKTIVMNDDSTIFFSRTYSPGIKEYLRNTLKENFF